MALTATELEDLLRQLAPKVLGAVVRRYGNFDLAEDATQEALLAATAQWSQGGAPTNPKGWLITAASRRLTDLLRSDQARRRREDRVAKWAAAEVWDPYGSDHLPGGDDTLILLFMCCHPSLSVASQIALTLRAVGGLTTAEIARAFLMSEETVTRRISRSKQSIKDSGMRFAMPAARELSSRLDAVLRVLYLIFNEGYASTGGANLQRTDLAKKPFVLPAR
jgi:RNA polymerase sigma factor (sigma-70 family)